MIKLRKYYPLVIGVLYGLGVYAQDAVVYKPAPYSSSAINSISRWTAVIPDATTSDITTNSGIQKFRLITQYIDGLGRTLQTVMKQGSLITGASAVDLVTAMVYDTVGRVSRGYLPFGAGNTGGNASINDGGFKSNPFDEQQYFYSDANSGSPVSGQGETFYYGKTEFEPSPLNRTLRTYSAGNNWVSSPGKGLAYNYWVNTVTDSVKIWMVTNGSLGSFGSYAVTGSYVAGELYKNVTIDENGKQVIEFKDRENKVILKKVQLSASADNGSGSGYTGWLSTYYVYDTVSSLRCVIQPAVVAQLPGAGWVLSSTMLAEGCFRYEYDGRRRMIIRKPPGAAEVDMIYDGDDRLIMSQDGNLLANHQYIYTQYDSLDRVISTGVLTDPANYNNPNYHRTQAAGSITYPNLAGYTYTELTRTFYDDYSWLASYGNPLSATRSTADDNYIGYTSDTTFPYPQPLTQSSAIKGQITGTRKNVLGSSTYLYTTNYYDDHYRVIQVQGTNITGGTDVVTTHYSFIGQPVQILSHTHKASAKATDLLEIKYYDYDSLNRLADILMQYVVTYNSNESVSFSETIATYQYDAVGHLVQKSLGNKDAYPYQVPSGTPLANQAYTYNIRGWLLSINKAYVEASTNNDQFFGMELGYDKNPSLGSFTPQYNGNIAGMIWKGEGDQAKRKYDFTYDAVNRLTGGNFTQYVSGSGNTAVFDRSAGIDYSVSGLNYDANGNILNLLQKGWKISSSPTIDSLTYAYQPGSNKLARVTDGASDTTIRLGDFTDGTNTGDDYSYDGNGNLIMDNNKNISSISYNYLNLPAVIHVTGKGTITYTYDGAGNKLQKVTVDSTQTPAATTKTLYIGNTVYINDLLQTCSHEEGRERFAISYADNLKTDTFLYPVFDYFLRDHLGNTRMILTENPYVNPILYQDTNPPDAYPDASLEDSTIATERLYYSGVDSGRVNKNTVPGYPSDTYTSPNNYIQQLSGSGYKVGTSIVIKVMAGDAVNIRANSWYRQNGVTPGTPNSPLASLVLGLAGGVAGTDPGHFGLTQLQQPGVLNPGITSFLNGVTYNTSKPKAFLNWILFDEQFHMVPGSGSTNSGFQQVGNDTTLTTHVVTGQVMTKSGWLFVYVSNETPNINVYFDNLQLTHNRGPILEETHYYPFGLTMAGISSQSAGMPENKYKFNKGSELQHKEFSNGSGLEMYETPLRELDPQLGRWWQIDSKPDYSESPYSAMGNNPILRNDPLGDTLTPSQQKTVDADYARMNTPRGDQTGWIRNATNQEYEENPVGAALKDFVHGVFEFFALNKVDDLSADIRKGGSSPAAITTGLAEIMLTAPAEGEGGEGVGGEKVPNPYGRLGSPEHRSMVAQAGEELQAQGYDIIENEVRVETPKGNKNIRYVDVQGTNSETNEVKWVQVGVQNKNGTPVSREQKAINDLNQAAGMDVLFKPYKTRQ